MSGPAHLGHPLPVQVEHLPGAGGSNLLVGQVARMSTVTTVARQHKDHLEERQATWLMAPLPPSTGGSSRARTREE